MNTRKHRDFTYRLHTTKAKLTSTRQISLDPIGDLCVRSRDDAPRLPQPSLLHPAGFLHPADASASTHGPVAGPSLVGCDFGKRRDLCLAAVGHRLLLSRRRKHADRVGLTTVLSNYCDTDEQRILHEGEPGVRHLRWRETRLPLRGPKPQSRSLGQHTFDLQCRI